jgi:hypothetical protein
MLRRIRIPILSTVLIAICFVKPILSTTREPITLQGTRWPIAEALEIFNFPAFFSEAKRMFYFEGAPGVVLTQLINLKIFQHFYPGLKIDDAIERFGQPSRTRSEGSDEIAIYELQSVRIEVSDHTYNSVFPSHRRSVYAYPKDPPGTCTHASSILNSALLQFVPMKGIIDLHIEEANPDGQNAYVLVKHGCIKAINWGPPK